MLPMKTLTRFSPLLLLVSCEQPRAADNYTFERPQVVLTTPQVTVHTYRNLQALRANAPQHARQSNPDLQAFTIVRPNSTTCEIHIVAPSPTDYHPELYGHELTHCLYGNFHPSRGD